MDQGITNGFTPVEFRPSAECTRGQVVTFLWRAKGCPEPNITENPFVDVSADSPYYKAILWAFEQGITTGYDETHFSPDKTCTRGQVVTFLWRCEGKPAPETTENPFEDVSAEGYTAPYYEAILWAAEQGITTGYDASHFCPDKTCNRGQVVTFIYRDMKDKTNVQPIEITDVIIEINPEAPASKVIKISNNPYENGNGMANLGVTWDFCPVNITATFSDGSSETVTVNVPIYNKNGDFTVPEDFVKVLATYGSNVYLSRLEPYGRRDIVVCSLDSNKAHFIIEESYGKASNDIKVEGNYIVYDDEYIYSMKTDIIKKIAIMANSKMTGDTCRVIGDTVYVIQRVRYAYWSDYRVFQGSYYDMGRKDMTKIGEYNYVSDFVFDETGYTITFSQYSEGGERTIHYDFPA